MTIQDLIVLLSKHQTTLLIIFAAIPFCAFLGGLMQGPTPCDKSNARYLYSVLVYLSCIPGMFSTVLTGYSVFFLRASILNINLFIYILPIISMIATLMIISRKASFDHIPGFQRIWGFMLMIAVSFTVAFILYRTVIFIGFIGKMSGLLVVAAVVFILMKIAMSKMRKG
ncbi:MAG: hypothetical protein GY765_27670 [bacterium]|nr:hypothetical protein [bacterium]